MVTASPHTQVVGRRSPSLGAPPPSLEFQKHNSHQKARQDGRYQCGSESLVLEGRLDDQGPAFGQVYMRRCKAWACPVCGPRKGRRLRKRLEQTLVQQVPHGFRWQHGLKLLTLTPSRAWHAGPEAARRAMSKAWDKLNRAMQKRYGKLAFFRILEEHKDGWPHFHILLVTPRFIPQAWIKALWTKYGIGQIVDIRNRTAEMQSPVHAARYLTKYLIKQAGASLGAPMKRWSQSRAFLVDLSSGQAQWWARARPDQKPLDLIRAGFAQSGFTVQTLRDGFAYWSPPRGLEPPGCTGIGHA